MKIEHAGLRLKLFGDQHVGRRFVHNVPLHRRGEREALVWKRFEDEFSDLAGVDYHINMGDVFDHTHVSFETILRAFRTYRQAAEAHPKTQFVVIRGNHDAGRDIRATTAYDILAELAATPSIPNVIVLQDDVWGISGMAFIPWRSDISAEDQVSILDGVGAEIVFGHWDTDARSDPHNLIPTAKLADLCVKRAVTGHVHLPQTFVRNGVEVIGTGSMMPFAHGEDATSEFYVTLSLEEAREQQADLRMMCVRIDLQEGEKLDFTIDCLQLQVRQVAVEKEMPQATMGEFSLAKISDEVAQDIKLPEPIEKELRARWQAISTQGL